jgi:hypothetical protein
MSQPIRSLMLLLGAAAALAAGGTMHTRSGGSAPKDALRDAARGRAPGTPRSRSDSLSLFGDYRSTSPHWSHIRTMVTDFRTHYVKNPQARAQEVAWSARHFDFLMSGDPVAYRATNPSITYLPYALDWDPKVPHPGLDPALATNFVGDMQDWFAHHPQYVLERAFLHRAGEPVSPSSRIQFKLWGAERWVINPGDPGARAYQADRIRRVTQNADGVFLDEHSSANVTSGFGKIAIQEYPDMAAYDTAQLGMLRAIRAAVAPKVIMINTGEYTRPFDREMILAAGGAQLERMNNPLSDLMEERWRWVDTLLAHGAIVDLVSLNTWAEEDRTDGPFRGVTPGDYASKAERMKLWELASYYLVVPATPDRLMLDLEPGWKVSSESVWLRAQEADIGHPRSPRAVAQRGTDPTGANYRIWSRRFDRALVLVRPVSGWRNQRYDDSTGVTIALPRGSSWRLLHGDGALGPPITQVQLRNMEAAILIQGSGSDSPSR